MQRNDLTKPGLFTMFRILSNDCVDGTIEDDPATGAQTVEAGRVGDNKLCVPAGDGPSLCSQAWSEGHGCRRKDVWSLAVTMPSHGSQEGTKMESQRAGVVRRGQARVKTWHCMMRLLGC